MTTVLVLTQTLRRMRVDGIMRRAVLAFLACGPMADAQERSAHWLHAGVMPPGAIGSLRQHRGGPTSGYFQPVRIRAPQGARIALASENGFDHSPWGDLLVGFQIGPVYRLRVSEIPNAEQLEVYPTVEIIDRLYPPPGLALRYPVPIELTQDELELAARGSFVTRVIYVEDPNNALPVARKAGDEQPWIEARAGGDPLVEADERGRPIAILRMGGRVPTNNGRGMTPAGFMPPFLVYDAQAVDAECPPKIEGAEQEVPASHAEVQTSFTK